MHPAIARMARAQMRIYRARTPAVWIRHDGDEAGDEIDVMFLSAQAAYDVEGVKFIDGTPTAWAEISVAEGIAPSRAGKPDVLFDNDDILVIAGVSYCVESCRSDGYGLVEISLHRDD